MKAMDAKDECIQELSKELERVSTLYKNQMRTVDGLQSELSHTIKQLEFV